MKGSIRIGRIAGIEIGVHYTWLLIFMLVTSSLALSGPQLFRGGEAAIYWTAGAVAAILLFACVFLHELAHSLVAKSRGLPVRSITFFVFGGVSNIEREPEKSGVEFTMAIVGPLTSLALGIVFYFLWLPLKDIPQSLWTLGNDTGVMSFLFHYLALVNIVLGVFNLLPGFPLDGGRILRSIIWGATNDLQKATNIAGTTGQLFGWALIVIGVFRIFSNDLFGGLWMAFIGWFLAGAAEAGRREVALESRLRGVLVKDAMDANPETIPPNTSVQDVVLGVFRRQHERAVPVALDSRVIGIVTLTDIKELPQNQWAAVPVEQIMTRAPLRAVTPDADLTAALRLLAQHDLNQLLVFDREQLVGIISRADIIRFLQVSKELDLKPGQKTS
ncbi:MAG: site-2 protease family protein [Chloroflexi bacterium]|nr:site-2 protease family protein [Chloroflexota bacterium]